LAEAKKFIKSNAQEGINEVLGELRQLFSKHKREIEHAVRRGIKRIRTESETALEELQKQQKQDIDANTKQKDGG
jgi:vacuolar-type H+-ATPase subunit E/Vma4